MLVKAVTSLMIVLSVVSISARAELNVDFEDLGLPGNESSWSGNYPTDGSGGTGELTAFSSRGVSFANFSDGDWSFWEGFAYSNMSDTTTPGFGNQMSAYTGTGYNAGDDIYAVGYVGFSTIPVVTLPTATELVGGYFTNTTYTALSMLNGDAFTKKFGGETGDDPDWLVLTITGKDAGGAPTGTVDFYLADYRFAENTLDYVLEEWAFADLSPLGAVKSLDFALGSSDVGQFGMNTPAYFAMDNLVVPEPVTGVLLGCGLVLLRRRRA